MSLFFLDFSVFGFLGFGQTWVSILFFLVFVMNPLPEGKALTKDFFATEIRFCQINVFIYCSAVDMFMIWSKKFILHWILHGFVL